MKIKSPLDESDDLADTEVLEQYKNIVLFVLED